MQASELSFAPLSTGAGSIVNDRMDVYTVDLELSVGSADGIGIWDLGFGVRHAAFDHDTTLSTLACFPRADLRTRSSSTSMLASSQFNGTGLTLGLGGKKPIRCGCASTLNLFWRLRGSLLWGSSRTQPNRRFP